MHVLGPATGIYDSFKDKLDQLRLTWTNKVASGTGVLWLSRIGMERAMENASLGEGESRDGNHIL